MLSSPMPTSVRPVENIPFAVRFPPECAQDQDGEWCELYEGDTWRQLRLHDYHEIYRIPGLYEHLFAGLLRCTSPERVVGLLAEVMNEEGALSTELKVLDVGAGNGMIGEQIRRIGARRLIGLDIIPEAAEAAHRDRPGLYDDYIVGDLCGLNAAQEQVLDAADFNALTTVSALGFGDIPPRAFANAVNFVADDGWLAFNIRDTFLTGDDSTGFCRLIRAMSSHDIIRFDAYRRYSHRLSVDGRPLNYVAMVARKLSDVPAELIDEVE
jgi:hypothetical protein